MSIDHAKNKRNYIRRKKYLNDSYEQIKGTLNFIYFARKEKVSEEDIKKMATFHAKSIEAACWSPHTRLSSENYQTLMASKTRELCRVILKKSLPNFDLQQLQKIIMNASASMASSTPSTPPTSKSPISSASVSPPSNTAQPEMAIPPRPLSQATPTPSSNFGDFPDFPTAKTAHSRTSNPQMLPLPFLPSSAPTTHSEWDLFQDPNFDFNPSNISIQNVDDDTLFGDRTHFDSLNFS